MQNRARRPVLMHKMPCNKALSEGVSDPGRNQAAPGFVHHRAIGDFIGQTGIARHAVYAPVAEETIVCRQLEVRVPAAVRIVAAHAAAIRLMFRNTIVVLVLVVAVPLHANTRRKRQVTVGIAIQPGQIPYDTVAVIQGVP